MIPTVLVIGGGPAGSTAAALLAKNGISVDVFEKEVFPRYHIGESILPSCLPILGLTGARAKVEAKGFRRKEGTLFLWGNEEWEYDFGTLPSGRVYAWQVERAEFDQLLLQHAEACGAGVFQGREVRNIDFRLGERHSIRWRDRSGQTGSSSYDFLIDASGRAGVLGNRKLDDRHFHSGFRNVAVWDYWDGALESPVGPLGATIVSSVEDGWVWAIPLATGKFSVGVVMAKDRFKALRQTGSDPDQVYLNAVQEARLVPDLLTTAERDGGLRAEQDYSYSGRKFSGPGYFICGDSACFLDPLLSTGIHLAMLSALLAAASIASIARGEVPEHEALSFYEASYRRAYLRLLVMVASLYKQYDGKESYFWQAAKLTPSDLNQDDLREAFVSIVSGLRDFGEVSEQELSAMVVERVIALTSEAEQAWRAISDSVATTDSEREKVLAKARFWASLADVVPRSEDGAVHGLYISALGPLGLSYS